MMNPRRLGVTAAHGVATAIGLSVLLHATGHFEAGGPDGFAANLGTASQVSAIRPPTVAAFAASSPEPPHVTVPASATTAPPATLASTTTLPQPIPPPADAQSPEPVVPLGRLAIPAIGIDRRLFEGIRLPTFDLGPGHWPGSALPGQPGNMVIGGHRTSGNRDFRDLDQLERGDEMIVTDDAGATFTYVVAATEITGPFSVRVIHQTPESTATLFACHPPGSVAQRIVVHLTLAV